VSAAYDLATYIQSVGGFATVGADMGVNGFMDKTDNELAVFEYSGLPEDATMGGTVAFEHPKIQIQVRNVSANQAWTKCHQIYVFLRGKMDLVINGHKIQYIRGTGFPHVLSRDDLNRTIYMAELEVDRSPEE
jgi:hypothetical protein